MLKQLQPGEPVLAVEHNDRTRRPRPAGRQYNAHVADVTSVYDDPDAQSMLAAGPSRVDAYYRDSGWRAMGGSFCWRLDTAPVPPQERP